MMNIKKIKIEAQKYKGVLIFALAVALVSGIFTWQKQNRYDVSLSLTVSRYGTQSAQDYKYDNYYAIKASDEFGETVSGWFKTPEMTQAIFKKVAVQPGSLSLDGLRRRFKAAKISPNLVEVRFSAKDENEARNLAQAVSDTVIEKTNLLNVSSWQGISFLVTGEEPVIVKNEMIIWWDSLAGFFVGLIVGFFVFISKEYFSD